MLRIVFAAIAATQAMMFAVVASGAEITGAVTLEISEKHGEAVPGAGKAFAGIKVEVYTPAYAPVAEGVTDNDGRFAIQVGESGDYKWLFAKAETGIGPLRGIYSGGVMAVDPVADALAGTILKSGADPESFTMDEIELIKTRLYELASAVDFGETGTATGTVEALLSNEPFRLALGDMVYTYSTPGDTVEDVRTVNGIIKGMLSKAPEFDLDNIKNYASEDVEIEFEGRILNMSAFVKELRDFFEQHRLLDEKTDFVRTAVEGDVAEVETVEKADFKVLASGTETRTMLNFVNKLVKTDGGWRLRKRWVKECVPEKAEIFAGGSSWGWVGARPCVGRFEKKKDVDGKTANIRSIYFAKGEFSFFWRLEIEGNIFDETKRSDPAVSSMEDHHIIFVVTLLDRTDGASESGVHSMVGMKNGKSYSLNQVRRIAPDGFPEELTYLPYNFLFAPSHVEGTVSLDEMKAVGDAFYANARIFLQTDDDKSEVLSEGVSVLVKTPQDIKISR